jgi:PAS domain-containing protein
MAWGLLQISGSSLTASQSMSKSVLFDSESRASRWIPTPAMAVKIAAYYAVLSALWILCSGWMLHHFVRDFELVALLEDIKGWFFVSVTATLLWLALARYFREVRRSAQMLEQSEARYRLLAENVEDFVSLLDAQENRLFISPSFYRVTGWTAEEIMHSAGMRDCIRTTSPPSRRRGWRTWQVRPPLRSTVSAVGMVRGCGLRLAANQSPVQTAR